MKAYMIIGMTLLLVSIFSFSYEGIRSKDNQRVERFKQMHSGHESSPPSMALIIGSVSVVGGIALLVAWVAKN